MDEKIEKAFAVANYMSTLSNQRRIILEEYNQKLVYYINGSTFKVTPELVNFTKTIIDLGHLSDVAFVDANNFPVVINNVQEFFDDIVEVYFSAINEYSAKFAEIKSKRKIADIVEL
jgi:predicted 3-demethylubiquinone-9 3-methyltransferase (glyoxalase superfamily)